MTYEHEGIGAYKMRYKHGGDNGMTYETGKVYTNKQGTGFIVIENGLDIMLYRITPEVSVTKTPTREGHTFHSEPRTTIERHLKLRGVDLGDGNA